MQRRRVLGFLGCLFEIWNMLVRIAQSQFELDQDLSVVGGAWACAEPMMMRAIAISTTMGYAKGLPLMALETNGW